MADVKRVEMTLQGIRALQSQPLSIIRLSESISTEDSEPRKQQGEQQRASDVSSSAFDNPSPASLEADLAHYKELFSKLRFSYLEQVTKEKFLRSIVGPSSSAATLRSQPAVIDPAENAALETHLAETKASLQASKQDVATLVAELDARARELSQRYETVGLQTELLGRLPAQIEGLEGTIRELRVRRGHKTKRRLRRRNGGEMVEQEDEHDDDKNHDDNGDDDDERPELNLPLDATRHLVSQRRDQLSDLDAQLKALRQGLPRQTRVLEQEEREVRMLDERRTRTVAAAREAERRRRRGNGADGNGDGDGEGDAGVMMMDEIEGRARWLRGVETGLVEMMDLRA